MKQNIKLMIWRQNTRPLEQQKEKNLKNEDSLRSLGQQEA